jgi:hypothetical protein
MMKVGPRIMGARVTAHLSSEVYKSANPYSQASLFSKLRRVCISLCIVQLFNSMESIRPSYGTGSDQVRRVSTSHPES